jgi:peroxiredoxin
MDSNEKEGVCYKQPTTLEERLAIARDFVEREQWKLPLLVDDMQNKVDFVYGGWPERMYVIETDGKIAYKGELGPFGFHPEEVEAWLEKRFPGTPASEAKAAPER